MFSTETLRHEILWNRLKEPIHSAQLPQDYLLLLAALDTGWKIHGPVRLINLDRRSDDCIYLFNLTHDYSPQTVQLAVPAEPVVETFLCDEGLTVLVNETPYANRAQRLAC